MFIKYISIILLSNFIILLFRESGAAHAGNLIKSDYIERLRKIWPFHTNTFILLLSWILYWT